MLRKTDRALGSLRQALELQESLARQNPGDIEAQSHLGGIYNNLGMVWAKCQRWEDACEAFHNAIERREACRRRLAEGVALSRLPQQALFQLRRRAAAVGGRRGGGPGRPGTAALWPHDPRHLVAVAKELVLAGKLLGDSKQAGMTVPECDELAVETLAQAVAAGWRPAKSFTSSQRSPR